MRSRMVRAGAGLAGSFGCGRPVMSDKLLQSKSYVNVVVPQIQFVVTVLDIPVASQRQAPTVFQVQFLEVVDVPVVVQRLCTQLQRVDKVAFPVVAQRQIPMVPSV